MSIYYQNTICRSKVCDRLKGLFALKNFSTQLTYDIRFKGKSYQSYESLLNDLITWPIEYRFTLSQPFPKYSRKGTILTYYVNLIKMC